MNTKVYHAGASIILIIFLFSCTNELPDNYLPVSMIFRNGKLEGEASHLEGFQFTMEFPNSYSKEKLTRDGLFEMINTNLVTGTLTYPDGRTTTISYEIVNHRDQEDIYMKTSLGYFLWEMLNVKKDKVTYAIYWWYCPPATEVDLDILNLTDSLLYEPARWHQADDRLCDDDEQNQRWSLFCALKYSSIEKMGEYNHHNTAMQTVRFVIDDILPDHGFEHTLMDYNNAPTTTHQDIRHVIAQAKDRIRKEIGENK